MITFSSFGIGKGLRERNPPNRSTVVFGAELNAVNIDGWYSPIDIMYPTFDFDLSTIPINHEVVVALINLYIDAPVSPPVSWEWRRSRDNALLFSGTNPHFFTIPAVYSFISWIGWCDWEINENGEYYAKITVATTPRSTYTLTFNVSGIPAAVPVPVPPGNPMDAIFLLVWGISDWFYQVYAETNGWIWPGHLVAPFFYQLYLATWNLLTPIAHFGDWVRDLTTSIGNLLSWSSIQGLILGWLPNIETVSLWFTNRWQEIRWSIEEWWGTTSSTVQGWITTATQGLNGLLVAWGNFWSITWPEWTSTVDNLGADLNSFFTLTLPTLVNQDLLSTWWNTQLAGITTLIGDTIKSYFPFYDDLVGVWSSIASFFTGPLDYLEARFADWFLGPEV